MADLIIVSQNPLENIENLSHMVLVVKGGKAYNRNDLGQMLEEVKK